MGSEQTLCWFLFSLLWTGTLRYDDIHAGDFDQMFSLRCLRALQQNPGLTV